MIKYENMAELLSDDKINNFSINKFEVTQSDFRALMSGVPLGTYVNLKHNGLLLMSNTPMEKRTNKEFIDKANGNVLIAGLGLALIVLPIQNKENIKSITIIEKHQEVIDLIRKQIRFNDKVNIIHDDIFTWLPEKGTKYDTIYFDIWSGINSDIYKNQMLPLKRKFKKYLVNKNENPNTFIKCWAEFEARYNRPLI